MYDHYKRFMSQRPRRYQEMDRAVACVGAGLQLEADLWSPLAISHPSQASSHSESQKKRENTRVSTLRIRASCNHFTLSALN